MAEFPSGGTFAISRNYEDGVREFSRKHPKFRFFEAFQDLQHFGMHLGMDVTCEFETVLSYNHPDLVSDFADTMERYCGGERWYYCEANT